MSILSLLSIEYGVECGVVVHLHLAIDLHILTTSLNILDQLLDSGREIGLLLYENIELRLTSSAVLLVNIVTLDLGTHMVYFECEDRQTVDSPRGGLGVASGVCCGTDIFVLIEQLRVDILHHIATHLIRVVDTAFEVQSVNGIDVGVADNILEVPLYGIDPIFVVEQEFERALLIGVLDRGVYVVVAVVVVDCATENFVGLFSQHISI